MALTTTTLSGAITVNDTSIVVASATGFAAGNIIKIDGEYLKVIATYTSGTTIGVLRGQNGTTTAAHVTGVNVITGLASDFAQPTAQSYTTDPQIMTLTRNSYTASGPLSFGTASVTISTINGTSVCAMTLANPTKDQDGQILIVQSNGAAAHTITYSAGFGGAGGSYDVLTANGTGTAPVMMIACNALWQLFPGVTGTLTNTAWALA